MLYSVHNIALYYIAIDDVDDDKVQLKHLQLAWVIKSGIAGINTNLKATEVLYSCSTDVYVYTTPKCPEALSITYFILLMLRERGCFHDTVTTKL